MPIRSRLIAGEMGAALAVLAVYVLVLLAPLHQAAGLQGDLARLGYESHLSWSVCTSVAQDEGETEVPASKCPLSGPGKFKLIHLPTDAEALAPGPSLLSIVRPWQFDRAEGLHGGHPGQPRAPPALA